MIWTAPDNRLHPCSGCGKELSPQDRLRRKKIGVVCAYTHHPAGVRSANRITLVYSLRATSFSAMRSCSSLRSLASNLSNFWERRIYTLIASSCSCRQHSRRGAVPQRRARTRRHTGMGRRSMMNTSPAVNTSSNAFGIQVIQSAS